MHSATADNGYASSSEDRNEDIAIIILLQQGPIMDAIILCMSTAMFKVHCICAMLGFLASHVTA